MDIKTGYTNDLRFEIKKFSDILDANNTALVEIARLQQQLQEEKSVTFPFIVKRITSILIETFKMIKSINDLCSNRYSQLFNAYEKVAADIKNKLGEKLDFKDKKIINKLVIPFSDIDNSYVDTVGEKIAFMCDVRNKTGIPVPDGFALTEVAYNLIVKNSNLYERINSMVSAVDFADMEALYRTSSQIQQLIVSSRIPDELDKGMRYALKVLKAHSSQELRVSVRSSALFESNFYTSFAGQYRSLLNVDEEEVQDAYLHVIASKFTPEAMVYAMIHGYEISDLSMCVGVQRMIDARTSGIMYTNWHGYPRIMIQAIYGLGLYIVNGSLMPDTYIYDSELNRITSKNTGEKPIMLICDRYGTKEQKVREQDIMSPSLDNDQIVDLAAIGQRLNNKYKMPLDIEWAIDARSNIYILQCRHLLTPHEYDIKKEEQYGFDIEWAIDEYGEPYILDYVQKDKKGLRSKKAVSPHIIPNKIIMDGGITASSGAAAGSAFHVNSDLDIMKFPAGAVAITKTANPKLAVLLKKTVGIISEKGDVTGHLATVAREIRIPALFGTGSIAISDGTNITLDAANKKVYLGTVKELVGIKNGKEKVSPSVLLLESLLEDIAVLNVPNPVNSNAQALKCKTIHDIIRFVHQIAIEEMFKTCDSKVSKGYHTRKIISPIPMDLIAFDLGGGIAKDAPEGDVPLEYVLSIPMKALWDGMMYKGIKWSGERNINISGLISAMTSYMVDEGASMRGLGAPSYVFISKNYMNFNSRVGYHFATIDTFIGEQIESNYINFRFSGGANALDRRSRRATLIEKILNDEDFVSIRTMDIINSRIQNLGAEQMRSKLEYLGKLLGFVNRLDISMVTDNDIDKYHNAFKEQRYNAL
jgi:pyruvate,water dikinase